MTALHPNPAAEPAAADLPAGAPPTRDPAPMLTAVQREWGGQGDLWLFGYGSLIWRPEFDFSERHFTRVHGWHRALAMWSRVNRGTARQPGLVLALLAGGSCQGVVFRVPAAQVGELWPRLWAREMPTGVYDPRWLRCPTPHGPVRALAFTLSRRSADYTGELSAERYRHIFRHAVGRYGSTLDYARQTQASLRALGIEDRALATLLRHAEDLP